MKKSKKNYSIIVLIVLLLALAIGYAAFSGTLTINGTAEGTGKWDVHFSTATLKAADGSDDTTHGTATITTTTNDTIKADVTLAYLGDGVILEAVVENSGNIPAKLTEFNVEGADDDLIITPAGPADNEILDANGGTCTAQFAIQWNPDSTATTLGKTFTVTYEYEQDTSTVTLTPAHQDTP